MPSRRLCRIVPLLLAAFAAPAVAQDLEAGPVSLDALGLTIRPPAGARAEVQPSGATPSLALVDGNAPPRWSMRIQALLSNLPDPTPELQIAYLLQQRAKEGARVLAEEPFVAGGVRGASGWVEQPEGMVYGWYCVPMGPAEFVVASIQVVPGAFTDLRGLLHASLSTLTVTPADEVSRERRLRLEAGQSFLEAVTPERLRTLVGRDQWYRLYQPAGTGRPDDLELGALHVSVQPGPMGAVNPGRDPAQYEPDERIEGLLVRVESRLFDHASGATADSASSYWMAWDGSEETWSVRLTTRLGGRQRDEAVTGVRTPRSATDPLGTIIVIASGTRGRHQTERAVPDVYFSQPLRWLLGDLLPRDGAAHELAAYCVEMAGDEPVVALRRDDWRPLPDGSGRHELVSRARAELPSVRSVHAADGALVERTHADGSRLVPIELAKLRDLWRRAGLEG